MRLIDADALKQTVGSYNPVKYTYEYGYVITVEDIDSAPTVDAVERKDLDEITADHENVGYEKGYRDGYAQSIEDAIEVVGINTWAGSRITKLQIAQERIINGSD